MAIAIRGHKGQDKTTRRVFKATAGTTVYTVRVDERGRVTLPAKVREELAVLPGTVFCIKKELNGFRLARVEDPFDGLARYAIEEDDAGRTRNLREYARERNIDLSDG
jgi:bifunctional DNA-binding transcriptional regulator/antitoxin component of YhaV-PrlF toxin-antitoxin module